MGPMQIGQIDLNKFRGLGDKALGLTKEFWGTVLDRDALVKEGEAQQAKGTEHLKALRAEFVAQKHEAKAELHETKQKVAQRVKQSA